MAALVEIEKLAVSFTMDGRQVSALAGISLTLEAGRITGLVGESGSGKSVLAASLLQLLPRNGRIDGGAMRLSRDAGTVDIARLNPRSRLIETIRGGEIGMVFQEPMAAFSPVHTIGAQMVETVTRRHGMHKRAARALAIDTLARVGIAAPEQRFDQYAFELSGGMRQRAMIATALIGKPKLLLADEPTTALDVTTQAQVLDLIRTIKQDTGMGVLLITHDLGVVAQLADEIAVIYLGRIVERGPVRRIFAGPAHPYTRNLLAAARGERDADGRFSAIPGQVPGPFDRPAGCPFHPRCRLAIAGRCDRIEPLPTRLAPDHEAACHLVEGAP